MNRFVQWLRQLFRRPRPAYDWRAQARRAAYDIEDALYPGGTSAPGILPGESPLYVTKPGSHTAVDRQTGARAIIQESVMFVDDPTDGHMPFAAG